MRDNEESIDEVLAELRDRIFELEKLRVQYQMEMMVNQKFIDLLDGRDD